MMDVSIRASAAAGWATQDEAFGPTPTSDHQITYSLLRPAKRRNSINEWELGVDGEWKGFIFSSFWSEEFMT